MPGVAFKEWAVVCRALAEGRQSLILRKGGIAEVGGRFRPEHEQFWLYPTYLHEHADGVKPTALPLFEQALAERPQSGRVVLDYFVQVAHAHQASDWKEVEALNDLHIWSPRAVRAKFDYRGPGLFVLIVRAFRASAPIELIETPDYSGCKTWVKLGRELPVQSSSPVLGDAEFAQAREEIERRLQTGDGIADQ